MSTREVSRRLSEADRARIRECLLLSSTLYNEVDSFPYGAATALEKQERRAKARPLHKDAEKMGRSPPRRAPYKRAERT